ncbi:hypothetical protein TNCV_4535821 [Trichonephila clavipes]|nr:hypothetical protein TNCV_4535821 [Trichonephila clavipes]
MNAVGQWSAKFWREEPSCEENKITKEVLQCEKKVVIADARSGLYGGCIKTSQPSSQRLWRVTTEVCGLALSCWNTTPLLAISGQSIALNGAVDSRDLNLVFGNAETTPNKHFLSSPAKYTADPSWPLVLVWPPFELLHRTLTTIVFAQYCSM